MFNVFLRLKFKYSFVWVYFIHVLIIFYWFYYTWRKISKTVLNIMTGVRKVDVNHQRNDFPWLFFFFFLRIKSVSIVYDHIKISFMCVLVKWVIGMIQTKTILKYGHRSILCGLVEDGIKGRVHVWLYSLRVYSFKLYNTIVLIIK